MHTSLYTRVSIHQYQYHHHPPPGVLYAEPDYIAYADQSTTPVYPTDPYFDKQWGFKAINAPDAWSLATGSKDVVICIIDSGIEDTHPDISANMIDNSDLRSGYNAINQSMGAVDETGHGTHAAGTIGAVTNNGIGVAGGNWQIQMVSCKFMTVEGTGLVSNGIRCLQWCASVANAQLMSNSWSTRGNSKALQDTMTSLSAKYDSLFVFAAGNDGVNNDIAGSKQSYPAALNLPCQVIVTSITQNGALTDFANFGTRSTKIAAPGSLIYSTYKNNGYASLSGTSMAVPFVSGTLALMKSASRGTLNSATLRSLLLSTAQVVPELTDYIDRGAKLDMAAAVRAAIDASVGKVASPPPPPIPISPLTPSPPAASYGLDGKQLAVSALPFTAGPFNTTSSNVNMAAVGSQWAALCSGFSGIYSTLLGRTDVPKNIFQFDLPKKPSGEKTKIANGADVNINTCSQPDKTQLADTLLSVLVCTGVKSGCRCYSSDDGCSVPGGGSSVRVPWDESKHYWAIVSPFVE